MSEKEVGDALIVLYKCSLKDKEYTTQKEQYKIVREYILQQQKEIKELKKEIKDWKFTTKYVEDNYVYKDKIREKIIELSKTQAYKVGLEEYTIKILKELLEE